MWLSGVCIQRDNQSHGTDKVSQEQARGLKNIISTAEKAAPSQPQQQQQQADGSKGPKKCAAPRLPLTAELLATAATAHMCPLKPQQRRWVPLLCGEAHIQVRLNAQLCLPSTTRRKAPFHWEQQWLQISKCSKPLILLLMICD